MQVFDFAFFKTAAQFADHDKSRGTLRAAAFEQTFRLFLPARHAEIAFAQKIVKRPRPRRADIVSRTIRVFLSVRRPLGFDKRRRIQPDQRGDNQNDL